MDNFRFLTLGTLANLVSLPARTTDGLARLVASMHWLKLATLETYLVLGEIELVAVLTGRLASFEVTMNVLAFFVADTASAIRGGATLLN